MSQNGSHLRHEASHSIKHTSGKELLGTTPSVACWLELKRSHSQVA
jgi:hypothetical protein